MMIGASAVPASALASSALASLRSIANARSLPKSTKTRSAGVSRNHSSTRAARKRDVLSPIATRSSELRHAREHRQRPHPIRHELGQPDRARHRPETSSRFGQRRRRRHRHQQHVRQDRRAIRPIDHRSECPIHVPQPSPSMPLIAQADTVRPLRRGRLREARDARPSNRYYGDAPTWSSRLGPPLPAHTRDADNAKGDVRRSRVVSRLASR